MPIYRFEFPIDDYYGEEVFTKQVYFEGARCPTHKEVVERLQQLADDEEKMANDPDIAGPHCKEYAQCLLAINYAEEELPALAGNLVGANIFCKHPKWGKQPISVKRIMPEKFEIPFASWYDM
jgi:hypothetical protein